MAFTDALRARFGGYGHVDADTGTAHASPWTWRTDNGIYVGVDGSAWMYRSVPLQPLTWEDNDRQLALGRRLYELLHALGETSSASKSGFSQLSNNREIHLVTVRWESEPETSANISQQLREYQDEAFRFLAPHKTVLLGVKLRPTITVSPDDSDAKKQRSQLLGQFKSAFETATGEGVPQLDRFEKDIEKIEQIFSRNGAKVPTRNELRQFEAHYNNGRDPNTVLYQHRDHIETGDEEKLEFAAVLNFDDPIMHAPVTSWLADAEQHPDGAYFVSVRGELQPPQVARSRARNAERRLKNQIREEAATGDLERAEDSTTLRLAKSVEDYFATAGREALLSKTSIIFGRRIQENAEETYRDWLFTRFGIDTAKLSYQQLDALDETLPCSAKRVNPFLHDVNLNMLAYAGVTDFSQLGDSQGTFVGLADPHFAPVFFDVLGAAKNDVPATTLIAGDSGSGKTFLTQSMILQAALDGHRCILINPKAADSLDNMAVLLRAMGRSADVVRMSRLEGEPGAFDPFRLAQTPKQAAEMASTHILTVLTEFTQSQRLALTQGLAEGADAGARCVAEALRYVNDSTVVAQVLAMAKSSTQFALGIGMQPMAPVEGGAGLTLIEFDRRLELPSPSASPSEYTLPERLAIASMRLVTRSTMELLAKSGGGIFALDEAWVWLKGNPEGLRALEKLSREGRSQRVLPILATQRVADLTDAQLDGFLSRVFVLKSQRRDDAVEGLRLAGMEPTEARISMLRDFGPKRDDDGNTTRIARAFHRDLNGRHALLWLGPTPRMATAAFSTNPQDRKDFEALRGAMEAKYGKGQNGLAA